MEGEIWVYSSSEFPWFLLSPILSNGMRLLLFLDIRLPIGNFYLKIMGLYPDLHVLSSNNHFLHFLSLRSHSFHHFIKESNGFENKYIFPRRSLFPHFTTLIPEGPSHA